MIPPVEHRESIRFSVHATANVFCVDQQGGHRTDQVCVENISSEGAGLVTNHADWYKLGQSVDLHVALANGAEMSCHGRVIHHDAQFVGVQYDALPAFDFAHTAH